MKKLNPYIKEALFIIAVLIGSFSNIGEKIDVYIPNFHRYLIGTIILFLLWSLIQKLKNSNKVVHREDNTIYLTTSNDYSRKVTTTILGFVGVIICTYLLLDSSFFNSFDVSLFFVISTLTLFGSFITDRSLKISISNDGISYQVEKIKKKFLLSDLEKIEFSNTTIYFTKTESKPQELSFLEITNKDLKTAVTFLKTKLDPNIAITIKS